MQQEKPRKQISQVLDAVAKGCETSGEVAALTGLSVATASAHLSALTRYGMIALVKRGGVLIGPKKSAANIYGPLT